MNATNLQSTQKESNRQAPHANLGPLERLASLALGAVGLNILWRKRPALLGLMLTSGLLLYRGISGHSPLYQFWGIDPPTRNRRRKGTSSERFAKEDDVIPDSILENPVDEASWESFPASDPPATW